MNRLLSMLIVGVGLAGGAADAGAIPVYAHYMPWFRAETLPDGQILWEHWQWHGRGPKHDPDETRPDGRRDIASVFYPLAGPYDGREPHLLEYHLLSARAAGIAGFIADWYGPGTYSDGAFGRLLDQAGPLGLHAAVCLEEKSFFPGFASVETRADVLGEAERQIRHVLSTHAASPAYLRQTNRPVIYVFVNHQQGPLGRHSLAPEEWVALRARFEPDAFFLIHGPADPGYQSAVDGSFGWVGDESWRSNFYATSRSGYTVGAVVPGFDDTGVWGWGNGPRVIERRNGATYDEHWRAVIEHRPDAVQVVTWNDFQEGSTIEPAVEYGFEYLDRTERWIERLAGRPARVKDNAWPYRLYRLRLAIDQVSDAARRSALHEQADRFIADWLAGRRLWMALRLGRLEARVRTAGGKESE